MDRSVPLWVLLLCLLFGALITVAFGWAVRSTLTGSDRTGAVGEAALAVASFPSTTKEVLEELAGYTTEEYRDESIRVQREEDDDYSGFKPMPTAPGIGLQSLLVRADHTRMADGWRVLLGAFAIDGDIENAALLISPDVKVVRKWVLEEIPIDGLTPEPKHRKFVHGMEILKDGSLIFTFDNSVSLQRVDDCGERQWITGGEFHHAVTLDESAQSVWTFSSKYKIAQVSVEDGSLLREIDLDDVIAANPMIDILEIRRVHDNELGVNSRSTAGEWLPDRFHFNDVDPLPGAIAARFEEFDPGDLLLSARSLNLVFVLDPDTLEIKWWRVGAVQRQHDPDWLADGTITVLNNRMSRDFSEIVSIDPDTFERTVIFEGTENDFYTRIRGKHQLIDDGALFVTSSQQGRAFEVDRHGEVVFEVVNLKPGSENMNYVLSELRWLPRDYFDLETWQCPLAA